MKIVFFDLASIDYPGGCEKYFAILAKYMSHKNNILSIGLKHFNDLMNYVYRVIRGTQLVEISYVKRDIGTTKKLNMTFSSLIPFTSGYVVVKKKLENADLIYSKNEFQELLILICFLRKRKYSEKVIVGVHTSIFISNEINGVWKFVHNFQYKSFLYKYFLNSAKKIHVINSNDSKLLQEKYLISEDKIKYIPYFIDWKTNDNLKKQYDNNRTKNLKILWAGRITQQKGIDRLELVIEKLSLLKEFEKIEIQIAGEGEGEKVVRELSEDYKNVKYVGFVTDLFPLYRDIDLAIVTSYFETFGYNVLEPQSLGIPVISYDIAGPRDIIWNNKTGFLVKNDQEFVDKILDIYRNRYILLSNKEIRKYINLKFSKKRMLKEIDQLFTNVE